ncbi:serine hydrolase [bacterium]|nr:serine hydrolase [bacterium]
MATPKYNKNYNSIYGSQSNVNPFNAYIEPEYEFLPRKENNFESDSKPLNLEPQVIFPYQLQKKKKKKVSKVKVKKILSFIVSLFLIFFVFPSVTKNFIIPLFKKPVKLARVDYYRVMYPSRQYLYNDIFMNRHFLRAANVTSPLMKRMKERQEMISLKLGLLTLMKNYPQLQPSIYVWDYRTGNYIDINSTKRFPAASIIKIPVLLDMFRNIELGEVGIKDEVEITDYYRAEGSGSIKHAPAHKSFTLDELAEAMITISDNSATNMIMAQIGGMPAVNRAIKEWGLSNTYIENWLPDLGGTNKTTTKDLGIMLYNIDNPDFLNLQSREKVMEYMTDVKNNRLIAAGLPPEAMFAHKTGDIGSTLGDAGIVYGPNEKKYIVAIIVNRPYNSQQGKDFIVHASRMIYNSIY